MINAWSYRVQDDWDPLSELLKKWRTGDSGGQEQVKWVAGTKAQKGMLLEELRPMSRTKSTSPHWRSHGKAQGRMSWPSPFQGQTRRLGPEQAEAASLLLCIVSFACWVSAAWKCNTDCSDGIPCPQTLASLPNGTPSNLFLPFTCSFCSFITFHFLWKMWSFASS